MEAHPVSWEMLRGNQLSILLPTAEQQTLATSCGQQRAAEGCRANLVSHKETSLWRPLNSEGMSVDGGSKSEELTGNAHRQPKRASSPLGEIKELAP